MSSSSKIEFKEMSKGLQNHQNSLKMKVNFGVVRVPKVTIILGPNSKNSGYYTARSKSVARGQFVPVAKE